MRPAGLAAAPLPSPADILIPTAQNNAGWLNDAALNSGCPISKLPWEGKVGSRLAPPQQQRVLLQHPLRACAATRRAAPCLQKSKGVWRGSTTGGQVHELMSHSERRPLQLRAGRPGSPAVALGLPRAGAASGACTPGPCLPRPCQLAAPTWPHCACCGRAASILWSCCGRAVATRYHAHITIVLHVPHVPPPAAEWQGYHRQRLVDLSKEHPGELDAGFTSYIQVHPPPPRLLTAVYSCDAVCNTWCACACAYRLPLCLRLRPHLCLACACPPFCEHRPGRQPFCEAAGPVCVCLPACLAANSCECWPGAAACPPAGWSTRGRRPPPPRPPGWPRCSAPRSSARR